MGKDEGKQYKIAKSVRGSSPDRFASSVKETVQAASPDRFTSTNSSSSKANSKNSKSKNN